MEIIEFNQRFRDLGDALIRRVCFNYPRSSEKLFVASAEVDLFCLDHLTFQWIDIRLVFRDVKSFTLKEGRSSNIKIFEARYEEVNGRLLFDFSADIELSSRAKAESYFCLNCSGFDYKAL